MHAAFAAAVLLASASLVTALQLSDLTPLGQSRLPGSVIVQPNDFKLDCNSQTWGLPNWYGWNQFQSYGAVCVRNGITTAVTATYTITVPSGTFKPYIFYTSADTRVMNLVFTCPSSSFTMTVPGIYSGNFYENTLQWIALAPQTMPGGTCTVELYCPVFCPHWQTILFDEIPPTPAPPTPAPPTPAPTPAPATPCDEIAVQCTELGGQCAVLLNGNHHPTVAAECDSTVDACNSVHQDCLDKFATCPVA
jgi:hypothetical protein